ncbi:ABC transporter substrate-binding protein [Chitinimonas sp. BJYL2]|uniref:substrate-binding periplasmic protein n=1 Tax=Chitinimonas sp. BJYL2 TaxID=2976696 RepID=UPI0022B4FBE9|nr:transporter substrate-binding domain-containing protein [Chitinimonas sp. BJYL2]
MLRCLPLLCLLLATFSQAKEIEVYASEQASYQYQGADGEASGFVAELVRLVLKEAGVKSRIQIMPWPRVQATKRNRPNTLFFTVYRNKMTEGQYRWVGKVVKYKIHAYRLKSRKHISVSKPEDFARYSVGVLRDGGRWRYLIDHGLQMSVDIAPNDEVNIRKFFGGRIDILLEDPIMLKHTAKRLGLDFHQAEKIYEIPELAGEGYLAFSLTTPDSVVQQFTQALAKAKANPGYRSLMKFYDISE